MPTRPGRDFRYKRRRCTQSSSQVVVAPRLQTIGELAPAHERTPLRTCSASVTIVTSVKPPAKDSPTPLRAHRAASPQPVTERGRRTRAALIEAAGRVFAERGYLDATIGDITVAAEVAHGTFYTYFESKRDLFASLGGSGRQWLAPYVSLRRGGPSDVDRDVDNALARSAEAGIALPRCSFDIAAENSGLFSC